MFLWVRKIYVKRDRHQKSAPQFTWWCIQTLQTNRTKKRIYTKNLSPQWVLSIPKITKKRVLKPLNCLPFFKKHPTIPVLPLFQNKNKRAACQAFFVFFPTKDPCQLGNIFFIEEGKTQTPQTRKRKMPNPLGCHTMQQNMIQHLFLQT